MLALETFEYEICECMKFHPVTRKTEELRNFRAEPDCETLPGFGITSRDRAKARRGFGQIGLHASP